MNRDRERQSSGEPEQDVALAVTVQRARPVLVGCGDVHAGGLDGGQQRRQAGRSNARLWLRGDEEEG